MADSPDHPSSDALLETALQARDQGDIDRSYGLLRTYLLQQDAIFRLARASTNGTEARLAAQLGVALNPSYDLGQRVLLDALQRFGEGPEGTPPQSYWPAIIAQTTGQTQAQARAIKWPFKNIRGSVGEALDNGTVTWKDLIWAADEAQEQQIRNTARTLLLTHLTNVEPIAPPQPMRVITGSRYTERQERIEVFVSGAVTAVVGILCLASVLLGIVGLIGRTSNILGFWGLGLIGLMFLAYWFGNRKIDSAINYRAGRLGEEQVIEALRVLLDSRWTLIRNFVWPGRRGGDIDLVLVGPGALWAFEVKSYSGNVRNIGDTWEIQTKRGWKPLRIDPGAQAQRNAAQLQRFLNEQGHPVSWVEPAVIWSYDDHDPDSRGTISVEKPRIPVWQLDDLQDRAQDLWRLRTPLTDDSVQAIVNTLQETAQHAQQVQRQTARSA